MNRIIAFPALVVGLAAQASAVGFNFQYESPVVASSGTSTVTVASGDIFNFPGYAAATGLTYSFPTSTSATSVPFTNGTGTLTSSVGAISFTFTGGSSATGLNGTLVSFTGGTGAYAGYTGTGVLSHTVNPVDPNYVDGQFTASIAATPEPASMFVLGAAGAALIRRRRAAR